MSSSRKKISIYDYPEHLNPFSEPTVPLRKTGKVFADRLNMSGTWSSKFTKRVNRSVTWIEKSWLGIDDSKKYKIQSAQQAANRDDSSKSTTISESRPVTDSNSNEKCESDSQQVRERIRETIVNPNELISSAKCDEEKKEIKKKKKRPAPQPPNAAADSGSTTPPKNSHSTSISSEKSQEVENSEADTSVETHSVSSASAVEKLSTSCESENADSRAFSDSSAYEPSSPRKSEHEDLQSHHQGEAESTLEECTAPTAISRPNRPSRSRDDEVKLAHSESDPPKMATEEQCSENVRSADAEDGDDEVFVSPPSPQPNECELEEDAHVSVSETKVEDCPVTIENRNGAVVQV